MTRTYLSRNLGGILNDVRDKSVVKYLRVGSWRNSKCNYSRNLQRNSLIVFSFGRFAFFVAVTVATPDIWRWQPSSVFIFRIICAEKLRFVIVLSLVSLVQHYRNTLLFQCHLFIFLTETGCITNVRYVIVYAPNLKSFTMNVISKFYEKSAFDACRRSLICTVWLGCNNFFSSKHLNWMNLDWNEGKKKSEDLFRFVYFMLKKRCDVNWGERAAAASIELKID